MNSESQNQIEQQAENRLLRLHELWQITHSLSNSQQQPLSAALQSHHQKTIQELQLAIEELGRQDRLAPRKIIAGQQYQELFESTPDAYLVTDREAIILAANPRAGKLLNCSQNDLLGRSLLLFIKDRSRYKFQNKLSQLQSGKKTKAWEVQIQAGIAPNPCLFKVTVLCNSDGQAIGLSWRLQNISQRIQQKTGLEMARTTLEQQMTQRTIELAEANEQLKQEIAERQRVEAALRQQTEWAKLMMAMQARIRQSLNLEEILNTTVAEVRQFLGSDRVVVYKVASTEVASVVAESVDVACCSLMGIEIDTPLFRERIASYRQGNTRVIHDIEQLGLATAINQFLQQQQVKASLTVPILHGDRFWGLLAIHQCSGARLWEQLEVELMEQLATQVSIAIGQSELYRQVVQLNTTLESLVQERTVLLQKSLDYEAMLKRISDDVRDTLDERQILQTAVWELAVGLNIHSCNTGLYDIHQGTSTIAYEYTVGIDSAQGQVVKMQDFLEGYQQLLKGEYFQFCELTISWQAPFAILACPIFDDKGAIGDLWLFKHPEAAFDELEIRLVQQVANQCAIAIRQARLYQSAQAKIQELETLNRLKDDFLDTVSQELRTPLANIKMAIQMLSTVLNQKHSAPQNQQSKEEERVARYLQILHNESERELNLINNLLDLQNFSDNPHNGVLTSIQLQEWLPQIAAPFQERSRHYQQSFSLAISPTLPRLICESGCLGRVVAELMHNACKYTPSSEKIVVKAIEKLNEKSLKTIQISVSNSGVEIPASVQHRIFEKFYRIREHDVWNQGGTGLGLALVQQLVTRLGGKIFVDSSAQQTCFTIELPVDKLLNK